MSFWLVDKLKASIYLHYSYFILMYIADRAFTFPLGDREFLVYRKPTPPSIKGNYGQI
ncbi:MAG: hypothetical protein HC903_13575 [Methylacidiphilales bacterium]|nr:hypothetical protein [Candidatus Methylacidiphilales bacterium]